MSTQTTTTGHQILSVPSGDEIYDALMSKIEMELITVNLPMLDEQYADETPDERKARYERYQRAYEQYDLAFAEWIKTFHLAVEACRREVMKMAEEKDRVADAVAMNALEAAFETATV